MMKNIFLSRTHKILISLIVVSSILIGFVEMSSVNAITIEVRIENKNEIIKDSVVRDNPFDLAIPEKYNSEHLRDEEFKMFEALNAYRTENGLAKLIWDEEMYVSATWKAQAMGQFEYFGHHNPQFDGLSFKENMLNKAFGYTYGTAGENLAKDIIEGDDLKNFETSFQNLKDSPSHNEAMLSEDFTSVGIGIICIEKINADGILTEIIYVVQHFRNQPRQ